MYMSKIFAIFIAIISFLYSWFPNSDIICEIYSNICGSEYDWDSVTDTLTKAVKEQNAELIVSLASPSLKEKHPDLTERIDSLFEKIEGEVLAVEDSTHYNSVKSCDYDFRIITTTDEYSVRIFYTAVDFSLEEAELGLRRVLISEKTDEYYSWWTDPDAYISVDNLTGVGDSNWTRRWCCGKGNSADEYVFAVVRDYSRIKNVKNVSLSVSRNSTAGPPATGYALHDDDVLKIHFIPEGEEPPKPGTRKPDATVTGKTHPNDMNYFIEPGRYYLYVEPSDMEMYYTVGVSTIL